MLVRGQLEMNLVNLASWASYVNQRLGIYSHHIVCEANHLTRAATTFIHDVISHRLADQIG